MYDYAGSGYRICEAVCMNSYNFMQHVVVMPTSDFVPFKGTPSLVKKSQDKSGGIPVTWLIDKDIQKIRMIMADADLIHIKSDFLLSTEAFRFLLIPKDKPIIQTVGGSFFRTGTNSCCLGKGNFDEYLNSTDKIVALTPDLNYPEINGVWIPAPIEIDKFKNFNYINKDEKPIISHSPSDRSKKGTKMFLEVCKMLKQDGYDFEVDIIEGVTHEQCMAKKARSQIFFDQNICGMYANSALEAMAVGIPTVAYISDAAIKQADGKLDNCPVFNCGNTFEELYDTLQTLINSYNRSIFSEKTKIWCEENHGYKAVGKAYAELYEEIICQKKLN